MKTFEFPPKIILPAKIELFGPIAIPQDSFKCKANEIHCEVIHAVSGTLTYVLIDLVSCQFSVDLAPLLFKFTLVVCHLEQELLISQ